MRIPAAITNVRPNRLHGVILSSVTVRAASRYWPQCAAARPGHELGGRSPAWLFLEIPGGEGLPLGVADRGLALDRALAQKILCTNDFHLRTCNALRASPL